mmetsp:Transcript_51179/g.158409  ORF Transcript_51179/g.158409 Transcript_51179/m.158409 type:complete len:566 (-) Transcript_51179:1085-2782(-)
MANRLASDAVAGSSPAAKKAETEASVFERLLESQGHSSPIAEDRIRQQHSVVREPAGREQAPAQSSGLHGAPVAPPGLLPPVMSMASMDQFNALVAGMTQIIALQQQQLEQSAQLLEAQRESMKTTEAVRGSATPVIEQNGPEHMEAEANNNNNNDDQIKAAIEQAEAKHLSPQVEACIKKSAAVLKKKMHSMMRSSNHVQKLNEQIAELANGRIPSGMKPFSLPYESEFYHQPLGEPLQFACNIDGNTSIAEAKRKVYGEYLSMSARLDLAAEQLRKKNLEDQTSMESFLTLCKASASEHEQKLKDFAGEVKAPEMLFEVKNEMTVKAAAVAYKKIIQDGALAKMKADQACEAQKKLEQQALDQAAQLEPHQVLEKWAENFMTKKFGKKLKLRWKKQDEPAVDYEKMLKLETVEPELTASGGKGGMSEKGKGKGKKGKGKGLPDPRESSTKGKGKGKENWKGKVKGNSKGKGKFKGRESFERKGKGKGGKTNTSSSKNTWYSVSNDSKNILSPGWPRGGTQWRDSKGSKGKGKSSFQHGSKGNFKGVKGGRWKKGKSKGGMPLL